MAYPVPTPDPYQGNDPVRQNVHPHPDPGVVNHPGLTEVQNRRGLLQALAVQRALAARAAGQEIGRGTERRLSQLSDNTPLVGRLLQGTASQQEGNDLVSFLAKAIGRPRGPGAGRYGGLF